MTNPLDRALGRVPVVSDAFSTRPYGTTKAEAAAQASGGSYTTGGSAEAAMSTGTAAGGTNRTSFQ